MEATLEHVIGEADDCRRLAELLHLDAVGVLRRGAPGRALSWFVSPGSSVLPLDVDAIVEGRVDGWVVVPRGDDVVFGRLTARSSARSLPALGSVLATLAERDPDPADASSDDPLAPDRARWAYAIHDGLTQIVTAAVLDLEALSRRVDLDPEHAREAAATAAADLRTALEDIRDVLAVVSPQDRERGGPLEDVVQGVAKRWRIPASWSIDGDLVDVPTPVLDAASSVIRESVANAAKHSASRRVAVRVHATPTEMEVRVEDGGSGFRPQEAGHHSGHLGLEMMRRRVAEVHGTLDIESEPGRGTRVVARLPVEQGDTP